MGALQFKIADRPDEFEQIFRLNFKTFVEEIPQHEVNPERHLVDKFHTENTYIICKDGPKLLGMRAECDKRPFSLNLKLENLASYLPPHDSLCEIRLLAVEPDRRSTRVFAGLILMMAKYRDKQGYDLRIISGTTRQLKMYRNLGFTPFGPQVGKEGAYYQPMYLIVSALAASKKFRAPSRIFTQPLKQI